MILRRVIAHFRKQEWTAIAIDFVIVVVGVFVGIQLGNWNDERKDQALAAHYLERIRDDLLGDIERFALSDSLADERITQIAALSGAASDPGSVASDPRGFITAMEKSTWRSDEPTEPGAYAELVATGRTTLVAPVALRDDIARYYSLTDRWNRLIADRQAQIAFIDATAGLLSASQLDAIEQEAELGTQIEEAMSADHALIIAQRFAQTPEATRWLPQMHKYQVLVKAINARHRAAARALIEKVERLH